MIYPAQWLASESRVQVRVPFRLGVTTMISNFSLCRFPSQFYIRVLFWVLTVLRLLSDSGNFIHRDGGRRHCTTSGTVKSNLKSEWVQIPSNLKSPCGNGAGESVRVMGAIGRRPGPRTLRIECGPLTCDLAVISFELIFALKSSHPHGGESESTFWRALSKFVFPRYGIRSFSMLSPHFSVITQMFYSIAYFPMLFANI